MVAMHQAFYRWAGPLVEGCKVVDAGCGEGFGANILAETAETVIGIDIKPGLLRHARHRYPKATLQFGVMDCTALSFPAGCIGAIVCNELIEHLPEHQPFLQEAHRVLAVGGRFICATTNAETSFKKTDGSPLNRNHFREFTGEGLLAALSPYFGRIEHHCQLPNRAYRAYAFNPASRWIERILMTLKLKHRIPTAWRSRVRETLTGVQVEQIVNDGFNIVAGSDDQALYAIAVATKT
jgi:ubiquinone/menaquinone biosynthesis C-methylase UbiE